MTTDTSCGCAAADPRKRVRYTHGMVLGEEDLVQEQAYLRARDHLAVRALHGYGTVAGLEVSWDATAGRLEVSPGLAVDPVGRLVCVDGTQCADLGDWLASHRAEVDAVAGSLPGPVSLYVVLCHRECETDTVPVPAESCRTAEESMAASRVLDSFDLRLLLHPPQPAGEVVGPALADAVGRLVAAADSLPADSLAEDDPVRRELLDWVTRTRPDLATAPCPDAPAENCGDRPTEPSTAVLLARVDLDPDDGTLGPPTVVQEDRPVLVSTRFLQEWLTEIVLHPELFGPPPLTDHNALDNLDVGDVHTQYLPVDGHRPLTGDLDAGGHALTALAASAAGDHAVRADEVFGADLARDAAGARLERLQGRPVATTGRHAPAAGDVLTFDGTQWVPSAGTAPPDAEPGPLLPLLTVEPMGRARDGTRSVFWLWFHPDAPDSRVELLDRGDGALVYGEHMLVLAEACVDGGPPELEEIDRDRVEVRQLTCATFRIDIRDLRVPLLRFVLRLEPVLVAVDGSRTSLLEHTRDTGATWVGQDGRETVTVFVLDPPEEEPLRGFEDVERRATVPGGQAFTLPQGPR